MGPLAADTHVELKDIAMPSCPEGGMVVRTLATGVNVALRARMQSGKPENSLKGLFGWWEPGEAFAADIVGEVIESKAKGYKVGDWVQGNYKVQKFFVAQGDGSDNPFKIKPSKVDKSVPVEKQFSMRTGISALLAIDYAYVSSAADYKWDASRFIRSFLGRFLPLGGFIAPSQKYSYQGKVAVVTAASSAVGVIAGQLLRLKGCKRVIGITSTKDKADMLVRDGIFDAAIARLEEDLDLRLQEEAPDGVDFAYEMGGGRAFQAVLATMNKYGKVVVVGDMHDANKNAADHEGIRLADALVGKSVEISGFFLLDYMTVFPLAIMKMKQLEKSGKLKSLETVVTGFENWGKALEDVLSSNKIGQTVVKVE